MTLFSSLEPAAEAALRFLVAVGEASDAELATAANQGTRSAMLRSFPLSGFVGFQYIASDLRELGLATAERGVNRPTERAQRLLNHTDTARLEAADRSQNHEPRTIIGVPSEPLMYAGILSALAGLNSVLFVDPYLAAVDLEVLQRVGTVSRVLTGSRLVRDRDEQGDRETLLAISAGQQPELQVRISAGIHDRYALPASGAGFMLGASLGGTKTTVVIELSEEATRDLRETHEVLWQNAAPVSPIIPPARR
ncbi:hypothetical protein [Microbacterium sp. Be9]|uniref:hypothetical protein n=1 Tax=Microbacterium TaxID=33882 RepID=UPI001422ED2A|nr:hypothetical protein [Microbacterium sp. Be9]NIG66403.1 hypothetical protein [Microbacterium sp. Be9]